MYFSLWYTTGVPNVFQYDFASGTYTGYQPPLGGSGWISGLGQIELGRDGKLYIIEDGGSNIIVINNPDDDVPVFSLIPIPSTTGLGISDHIQSEVFDAGIDYTDTLCAAVSSPLVLLPDVDGEYWWATSDNPDDTISIGSSLLVSVADSLIEYIATGVSGTECFSIFNQYQWSVFPQPDVDAGPDKTIQTGQSTTLDASTGVADGKFDANDIAFASVKLWKDLNQEGISQGGELFTFAALGIESISVTGTASNVDLGGGNTQTFSGSFTRVGRQTGASPNRIDR